MSYKQVRTVKIEQMGSKKGECLKNTRLACEPDVPSKYSTAKLAADKAVLHPGTPPQNVWVPVYFDFWATIDGVYKNWGHVGWYYNGAFYSDGTKYNSIDEYQRGHAPRYIGWGELLNDVRIIEYVEDPKPANNPRDSLHLNKGTISTLYLLNGKKGSIYARDDTYDYTVREDQGYRVKIRSASGGGEGWIYLIYQTGKQKGQTIPGRYLY